jgi:amino acid transporter
MAVALPIIIYNFLGFELMSSASNEMRNPRRDVPRTIVIAGVLIGAFYLLATFGMQALVPVDEISDTKGLMDALIAVFGDGIVVKAVGVAILYAFFAALIPWTIGANRAAAEAAAMGDLPPLFGRMSARRDTPVGAAGLTAIVSAAITLVYGALFSLTDGSIDELFWSLFAFSSVVFLMPYVAMVLAFLRLRTIDRDASRPYRVPGGRGGALAATALVLVSLALAAFFFVWNPFDAFDPTTFWCIVGGLTATVVLQEVFVARAPRWAAAVRSGRHPEADAEVDLSGVAPDDPSTLHDSPAPQPDREATR